MEKFTKWLTKWLKFWLEVIICLVKYIWLVVRVPLSLPAVCIVAFCFIFTFPLWFFMACIASNNGADEVISDFCNWYVSPAVNYWIWCLKTADPHAWSHPAQNVLDSFPLD